jgi:condensin complex subunit 2
MARRTRVRTERPPHDEDSDDGYEQETPRQNKIRKRLSESNNPDASFGADSEQGSGSGRPPLHAVNINDDAAEKRRRRRSNRNLLDTSQPGPSSDANMESETGELSRSRNQRPLNSVIPPPEIAVPLAEMASNYEEWMKMATDNVCRYRLLFSTHYSLMHALPENYGYEHMGFCPH